MIFYSGLESLIECIYLNDEIGDIQRECNIYVNPVNIKYLTGKQVIINSCEYSSESIRTLLDNGCKIISRVYNNDLPNIEVRPYILNICNRVMWNGRILDEFVDFDDLLRDSYCEYDIESNTLYFPKFNTTRSLIINILDEHKNLSALGWVLQQVGMNIKTDTVFNDLDIIKTRKLLIE